MRILHIITLSEIGGAQTVVMELANHAAEGGHSVAVLSSREGELWDLLDPRVEAIKTDQFRRSIDPLRDIAALFVVLAAFRRFRPDIVHLHSSKAGFWGRTALFFASRRIVYTVHGFDSILMANKKFLPVEKLLRKRGSVIAVSAYDAANLEANGIKVRKTILNGVQDAKNRAFPLEAVEGDGAKYRVCVLARLSPQKRFDLFVETAKRFVGTGYSFYWIGNREPQEGLPPNAACLGEIPDARSRLGSFHLFFLPSAYEGLPMSILEALSAGLPVVASDVGGIREVLDGKNGIAAPNDPDAMARAIRELTADEGAYAAASSAARQSYQRRLSAEIMCGEYEKLYGELAAAR